MVKSKYTQLVFLTCKVFLILLFAACMVLYPKLIFNAALRGLDTWWRIVFPALLPFFVLSEILMGLGLVNFLGVILEPIMRPLFNLPGASAFALAVGYTSGAPIGAVVTAKLRRQNLCSKAEASHLMAFTNNASPLFMFGAVAVGMFNNPAIGPIIAGVHYLANLCVGIVLRFFIPKGQTKVVTSSGNSKLFLRAVRSLWQAYRKDERPFGKLLGDAIKNSVQTLLTIGGFIIIFSVIIETLDMLGLLKLLSKFLAFLLAFLKLDHKLFYALSCGFIEMTIGTKLVSESIAPLEQQLIATSLILAWLGLSVHGQAISMVADTDIDVRPYLIGRLLHSIFAAFWLKVFLKFNLSILTFARLNSDLLARPWLYSFYTLKNSGAILLILILISLALSLFNYLQAKKKILSFTIIYKKNK